MRRAWAAACLLAVAAGAARADGDVWQARHDQLVQRLRALAVHAGDFGPAYRPLYEAALPWYEEWGGKPRHAVDDWMIDPEQYATELADALEHGRNFLQECPGALVPLTFSMPQPGGGSLRANYWIILPEKFGEAGRRFPLIVGLHGSGWLGHKISFVRKARKGASGGRAFEVTPIDEAGPWRIDFLNAYLDELIRILPIDVDRVYVEGHSLGAMATWEWALDNPERFAAISPRAGVGEPFRAARLAHVPAWVIHGADDDVVPSGFGDEMVSALENAGAPVRYSLLPGVPHNMPEDLDEPQVVAWYFRQTRSHVAPPADPLDQLGLDAAGFSAWQIVTLPGGAFYQTGPVTRSNPEVFRKAALALFQRVHDRGGQVDTPLVERQELTAVSATLWLAAPRTLRLETRPDPAATIRPPARYVRFYARGERPKALAHVREIAGAVSASGGQMSGTVWIAQLTLWPDLPASVAEYCVELK